MMCPHGQGGTGRERVSFCDFVRTSFMDGPLLDHSGFLAVEDNIGVTTIFEFLVKRKRKL